MTPEMEKKKQKELRALGEEMLIRREAIRKEWRANPENRKLSRGTISTSEMKALNEEEKRRYGEILAKYKDK